MNTSESLPWYQEKWVWLLVAIPATSIVLGIVMITLALGGRDSLVKDDYYKEGRMINFELKKDQFAKHLGLQASLAVIDQSIAISLQGNSHFEPPALVNLQIIHPTLANADLNLMLIKNDQQYIGKLPEQIEGRRYLQLTDQESSWRLKGESWFPTQQPALLEPSVPEASSTQTKPSTKRRDSTAERSLTPGHPPFSVQFLSEGQSSILTYLREFSPARFVALAASTPSR